MGRVQTVSYWENYPIQQFTEEERADYSADIQRVLAHPTVAVLDSKVVGTKGVLITEQNTNIPADSDYGVVIYVSASASNPDWTRKWRTLPLKPRNKKEKEALKEFKQSIGLAVAEIIVPKWFPELAGVENGVNLWPIRLDSTFIVVPNRLRL